MLLKRIDEAAKQGYAVVQNQVVMGDSVAAAITDHRGSRSARSSFPSKHALTVDQARERLVPHVQFAATALSQTKVAVP